MASQIAIDMGGTNLRVARIENGKIITQLQEPCKAFGTKDEVLEQLYRMISQLNNGQINRIGVAVPSIVDSQKGIIYNVQNIPSWKEVHLKALLEEHFQIETRIDNDVNCFVNAERIYGVGRPFHNFVGITLGTGVGAGIVIDDKLYRGIDTGAGEIGCLPYLDGIYEDYTSSMLFRKWNTNGKEEAEKAAKGDKQSLERWKKLGFHLGKLLQVILYTYNPEAIVIGGGLALSRLLFEKEMISSMRENFVYPREAERVQVRFSTLKDSNILGAAEL